MTLACECLSLLQGQRRVNYADPHETEPESCPAVDSARSVLGGRRAKRETVSNVRWQSESEAEGHQECRYDAHEDEDREQCLVDEAELESDRRDDELHRPASVHRDSRGHGVPQGKLGPARADVPTDELAQDRHGQDGQDERRVGQALHDDGQTDEREEHGAQESLRDCRRGGADLLRVPVPDDMLGHEERPEERPDDEVEPEEVRKERESEGDDERQGERRPLCDEMPGGPEEPTRQYSVAVTEQAVNSDEEAHEGRETEDENPHR